MSQRVAAVVLRAASAGPGPGVVAGLPVSALGQAVGDAMLLVTVLIATVMIVRAVRRRRP